MWSGSKLRAAPTAVVQAAAVKSPKEGFRQYINVNHNGVRAFSAQGIFLLLPFLRSSSLLWLNKSGLTCHV